MGRASSHLHGTQVGAQSTGLCSCVLGGSAIDAWRKVISRRGGTRLPWLVYSKPMSMASLALSGSSCSMGTARTVTANLAVRAPILGARTGAAGCTGLPKPTIMLPECVRRLQWRMLRVPRAWAR